MNSERLLRQYERIADAPDAIARLRRFVLDLAVRGKLIPQDPRDEPASELLKRIVAEKVRLMKAGEIKKEKPLAPVDEEVNFEVPPTWQWTRLGTISSYIQRGKSPKYAASGGSPVVSQKCVQWTGLDLSVAKQVTLESLTEYEDFRFLRDGDLLWNSTGTGTIGRIIRLVDPPQKLVCDSHVTVIRCLEANPEYVRTWLRSDHVYALIEDRAAGSTNQVELTSQMAIYQLVPLPPLAEQHRIIAKVDELMALCDRLEAARAEREAMRDKLAAATLARVDAPDSDTFRDDARFALDALPTLTARADQIKELRQTILNFAAVGRLVLQDPSDEPASELLMRIAAEKTCMMKDGLIPRQKEIARDLPRLTEGLPVSWQPIALGEVCAFVTSGSRGWADFYADSGPGFIRAQNIRFGKLRLDDLAFVNPPSSSEGMRTRVAEGDLFIVITGAGVTNPARLDRDLGKAYVSQHVALVRPIDKELSEWFLLCLMAPAGGRSELIERAYGAGKPGLNLDNIRTLNVPIPPLAEQRRIIAKVDELMTLCDRLEATLTTAVHTRSRLLDALLAEALTSDAKQLVAAE